MTHRAVLACLLALAALQCLLAQPPTAAAATVAPKDLVIFLSPKVPSGNIGGLSGADAICQSTAGSPNFVALLPDFQKSIRASDRVSSAYRRIVNVKGEVVASSKSALFASAKSETGGLGATVLKFDGSAAFLGRAFTGSAMDGSLDESFSHSDCNGWTSSSYENPTVAVGYAGRPKKDDTWSWIAQDYVHCDRSAHFYCIQTLSEAEAAVQTLVLPGSGAAVPVARGNNLEDLGLTVTVDTVVPSSKGCIITGSFLEAGWLVNNELCCYRRGITFLDSDSQLVCKGGCSDIPFEREFYVLQDTGSKPVKRCFVGCYSLV